MSQFEKLYDHLFNHLAAEFSKDGRTAVFSDGAHSYEVRYDANGTPVSIRHMSQASEMRRGDQVAPWGQRPVAVVGS